MQNKKNKNWAIRVGNQSFILQTIIGLIASKWIVHQLDWAFHSLPWLKPGLANNGLSCNPSSGVFTGRSKVVQVQQVRNLAMVWPITDTECQIWANSTKLSLLTFHIFKFNMIRKKRPQMLNNKGFNLIATILTFNLYYWINLNFLQFFISFSNISPFWSKYTFWANVVFWNISLFWSKLTLWAHVGFWNM